MAQPCNCGGASAAGISSPQILMSVQPFPDEIGRYHPRSEDPSDPLYTGVFENESVYIVGFGTENEQFFPRAQREEAFSAARSSGQTIDHLRACGLAEGLMMKLFGA